MSDLPLRAACIHGRYEAHSFDHEPLRTHCLGGRDIIKDQLVRSIAESFDMNGWNGVSYWFDIAEGVDAAIRDTG